MKIVINKETLSSMLKGIKKGVKKDSKNIIIEATGEVLKVTSYCKEFEITTENAVDVVQEGEISVDFPTLEKVINMTDGLLTLNYQDDVLIIQNEKNVYELKADIINIGTKEVQHIGKIESSILKESIKSVIYAVGKDAPNPTLNGITIHKMNSNLNFMATDSYRMAVTTISEISNWDLSEIILDGIGCKVLEALLPKECEITVEKSNKFLIFKFINKINFSIKIKIIDGKAINYNAIMPKNFNTSIIIDKKQLEKMLKNIVPLYKNNNHAIQMNISENVELLFKGDTIKINSIFDGKIIGEQLQICFNPKYLLDIVKHVEAKTIKIDFVNQVSPCFVQDGNAKSILLPVRMVRE